MGDRSRSREAGLQSPWEIGLGVERLGCNLHGGLMAGDWTGGALLSPVDSLLDARIHLSPVLVFMLQSKYVNDRLTVGPVHGPVVSTCTLSPSFIPSHRFGYAALSSTLRVRLKYHATSGAARRTLTHDRARPGRKKHWPQVTEQGARVLICTTTRCPCGCVACARALESAVSAGRTGASSERSLVSSDIDRRGVTHSALRLLHIRQRHTFGAPSSQY